MKLRSGFVSNSSSSSFVISGDAYSGTFDIAEAMLKERNDYWEEWKDLKKSGDEDISKLQILRRGKDPNTPLSFRSTNYDTYITKIGNYYFVSTCNNIPFYNMLDGVIIYAEEAMLDDLPEDFQIVMKLIGADTAYAFQKYLNFNIPRIFIECGIKSTLYSKTGSHDRFGDFRRYQQGDFCKKHYNELLDVKGEPYCTECKKEKE